MNNIGIIAGGGKLPIVIGRNLIKKKFNICFFVIEEFFNTKYYKDFDVTVINLKSAKNIINSLKYKNIDSIIMAGNINRPSLTDLSFDYQTFKLAKNFLLNKTGDDGLLISIKNYFNDNGFSYFDWKKYCPELFANKNILTQIKPSTNAKKNLPQLIYCTSVNETCKDVDAIIIATEWNEFRALDLRELKKHMKNKIIFDLRNIYNKNELINQEFEYYGIGK